MDRLRILIMTADAGFGHRSAANAIAAALTETYAQDCIVDIVNPFDDPRIPTFLRDTQADQDRMVREMPELYRFGYEASDATFPSVMVESALSLMLFEVIHDLVSTYRPSVVVTTYLLYQAPLDAVRVVTRKRYPIITIVTDLTSVHRLWFNDNVDACMVPTPAAQELAIKYGLGADRVHLTGIPVHPRLANEKRSKKELRAALGWRDDLPLIFGVGSRRVRNLEDALRVVNHMGIPLQLAVAAGGDDDLYRRLQQTEWHIPVYLYNFVNNMPEMLHAADCLITKAGGLIVTEALACGLPLMLVDVNPGQEVGNAEYVLVAKAGMRVENTIEVLETMYHWLSDSGRELARLAVNAKALGKPQAAYTITDIIWNIAREGLPEKRRLRLSLERSKWMNLLKLDDNKNILSGTHEK